GPILMCGGAYLCYEGAHKIFHKLLSSKEHDEQPSVDRGKDAEDRLVKSAITTDLILSAEIMVISLNSLIDQTFWLRLGARIAVALRISIALYRAGGLPGRMHGIGRSMLRRRDGKSAVGKALGQGMPHVLTIIGLLGTAAMRWGGGHIII